MASNRGYLFSDQDAKDFPVLVKVVNDVLDKIEQLRLLAKSQETQNAATSLIDAITNEKVRSTVFNAQQKSNNRTSEGGEVQRSQNDTWPVPSPRITGSGTDRIRATPNIDDNLTQQLTTPPSSISSSQTASHSSTTSVRKRKPANSTQQRGSGPPRKRSKLNTDDNESATRHSNRTRKQQTANGDQSEAAQPTPAIDESEQGEVRQPSDANTDSMPESRFDELPEAVRSAVNKAKEEYSGKDEDWREICSQHCLRQFTRKEVSIFSHTDGNKASCRTCTNSKSPCIRIIDNEPALFPLPTSLRASSDPKDIGYWLFQNAKKSPGSMWRT